jgi:hypothetical protein
MPTQAMPVAIVTGGSRRFENVVVGPSHYDVADGPLKQARFGLKKRRGRDLNPRRTQEPETVFETAAFDRSATPPRDAQGTRRQETVMLSFIPAASWPGTVQ